MHRDFLLRLIPVAFLALTAVGCVSDDGNLPAPMPEPPPSQDTVAVYESEAQPGGGVSNGGTQMPSPGHDTVPVHEGEDTGTGGTGGGTQTSPPGQDTVQVHENEPAQPKTGPDHSSVPWCINFMMQAVLDGCGGDVGTAIEVLTGWLNDRDSDGENEIEYAAGIGILTNPCLENLQAEVDARYAYTSSEGQDGKLWSVGTAFVWNEPGWRFGPAVGFQTSSGGGFSSQTWNYGGFAEWYPCRMITPSARGGGFTSDPGPMATMPAERSRPMSRRISR
jgi:hypothetical protein